MEIRDGRQLCSWEDLEEALGRFQAYYRENKLKFQGIYTIPRGGLVPAVCLSHRLGLPILSEPVPGKTLIVDDIADTGKTLEQYKSGYFIFTIFYHPQSSVTPNFWVYEKGDEWVVFPWERRF